MFFLEKLNVRGRRGAGVQTCDCNATVASSIPLSGRFIFFMKFSSLRSGYQSKNATLSPATANAMPRKLIGKWRSEYLNTRFLVLTRVGRGHLILYVEYSVKLTKKFKISHFFSSFAFLYKAG